MCGRNSSVASRAGAANLSLKKTVGFQESCFLLRRGIFFVPLLFLTEAFFVSLIPVAEGAYFYVQESQDKCFVESVPQGVPMTVSFKNAENPGVTCNIVFKEPSGRSVYSKEVLPNDTEGKVSHMTNVEGEYKICISCASSKWYNTQLLKWSISIELGDTDINIQDLAKKDEVNGVHVKLQSIANRLEVMQAENDYERLQEDQFQRTSESINSRIVWFSVLQLLLLCCSTFFSIFYLLRYFHSHKII